METTGLERYQRISLLARERIQAQMLGCICGFFFNLPTILFGLLMMVTTVDSDRIYWSTFTRCAGKTIAAMVVAVCSLVFIVICFGLIFSPVGHILHGS